MIFFHLHHPSKQYVKLERMVKVKELKFMRCPGKMLAINYLASNDSDEEEISTVQVMSMKDVGHQPGLQDS